MTISYETPQYNVIFYKPFDWEGLGALQTRVHWESLFTTEIMGLIEVDKVYKVFLPMSEYIQ